MWTFLKRATAGAACTLVVLGVAAVAHAALGSKPVVAVEAAGGSAAGTPDLTRVSLQRSADGRLRAAFSFADDVPAKALMPKSGPPGSVCLRVYVATTPGALPPDYLVCATADAKGRGFRGSVLAEQVNALPKKVATAEVSRSRPDNLVLRFSQSAVGHPAQIRFTAEATRAGCTYTGCVDTLPDAPGTKTLTLRLEAPAEG